MVSPPGSLPWSQKIFFGFGHVLNDMCASMWFNYLLVYYHSVLSFSNLMSGTLLLIGQIADGLTTPVIGYESDRISLCRKYGRRKSWHLFGFLMVFVSFIFIFNPCFACTAETYSWARFAYFSPIIVIFQIGWAATQISHLSLIPVLSPLEQERVSLTSIRYAFTVASNFVVFGTVTGLLALLDTNHTSTTPQIPQEERFRNGSFPTAPAPVRKNLLTPADVPVFRYLVIIVVAIGSLFTIGFHLGVKEPGEEEAEEGETTVQSREDEPADEADASMPLLASMCVKMKSMDWFKEPHFYLVSAIYICVRLITNLSQVYMTLFINDTLRLNKLNLALVPLTIYAVSMLTSFGQRKLNRVLGRTITLGSGMLVSVGFSVMIYFTQREDSLWRIYMCAVILGLATAILMIGSLSLTADLIGSQCQTSAFVYGIMSFGDKFSNGIAVEIIQTINPQICQCPENEIIYRHVEIWGIGGISIVGLILTFILATRKIDKLHFYKRAGLVGSVNNYNGFRNE